MAESSYTQYLKQEFEAQRDRADKAEALLWQWSVLAPESDAWWCPACGETDCKYNGSCEGCGLPIEDSQPSFNLIDDTRAHLGVAAGVL